MIYPSIEELTHQNKYNRYTLVIATAKCARELTDEYVEQREIAEKLLANKETDKSLASLIKKEYRDEKAVKVAINRIHRGEYCIDENAGRNIPAAAPATEPQKIDMDLLRATADEDEDEDIDEEELPAEDNESF